MKKESKCFVTIELSVSLLRLKNMKAATISSLINSFSFNHAICILTLHCSERFIIRGTALKFSAIFHYEYASLFSLKNEKISSAYAI